MEDGDVVVPEFRVVSARQLNAGNIYFLLTIDILEPGEDLEKHTIEVAISEEVGNNDRHVIEHFKQVKVPKVVVDRPELGPGEPVEVSDFVRQGAAYAVGELTRRSNSLIPWTLVEVSSAKVLASSPDATIYELALVAKRSSEEKSLQVQLRYAEDMWSIYLGFAPEHNKS
mmetsp:Transcript_37046/g.88053  ORF Transcript_37046/g.88053 Transcript_37046/m.88053 type:complete len:171 (+) Transcript_37046:579-1091(+)|eukprot:CAMPEP_0177588736 /NCGR_PEP_ID=MMETSP0419_2-20121207/6391_1 /TAXON_ID=582737 /ORGANISM="Tetraselmis sp., Strain GSL018" /LENGTH=170 /DNA_ID=CAMNT_0019078967 /DNA_START=552 /DNA_END=1064 /DNA_ORIENTATION=+